MPAGLKPVLTVSLAACRAKHCNAMHRLAFALRRCCCFILSMMTWYRFEKPVFQWQQPPQVIGSPISPQPRRAPMPSSNKVRNLSPDALVHVRGLAVHNAWVCCSDRTSLTFDSDAAHARAFELAGSCICACETLSACRLHNMLSAACWLCCINCQCLWYAECFAF
jgi:hypothetical protein